MTKLAVIKLWNTNKYSKEGLKNIANLLLDSLKRGYIE